MNASNRTAAIAHGVYLYASLMNCIPATEGWNISMNLWIWWMKHPRTTAADIRIAMQTQAAIFDQVIREI